MAAVAVDSDKGLIFNCRFTQCRAAEVGHNRTVTYSKQRIFNGLLNSESCRMAYMRSSAGVAVGLSSR